MALVLDGSLGVTFPSGSGTQAAQSKVLQVVNSNSQQTTGVSTTSTTLVSTGISLSITPIFATSKIYIVFSGLGQLVAANQNYGGGFTFYRGSTNLATGTAPSCMSVIQNPSTGNANMTVPLCMQWFDSPATTSSTTYTIYFAIQGSGSLIINPVPSLSNSTASMFTLMEIAA